MKRSFLWRKALFFRYRHSGIRLRQLTYKRNYLTVISFYCGQYCLYGLHVVVSTVTPNYDLHRMFGGDIEVHGLFSVTYLYLEVNRPNDGNIFSTCVANIWLIIKLLNPTSHWVGDFYHTNEIGARSTIEDNVGKFLCSERLSDIVVKHLVVFRKEEDGFWMWFAFHANSLALKYPDSFGTRY